MTTLYLALMTITTAATPVAEFCRACQPKPVDHLAAVRKRSADYSAALLAADEIALVNLLHVDYQGERVPWGLTGLKNTDRLHAVVFWNRPHKVFSTAGTVSDLNYTIESVRVFGDAAVETGMMLCTTGVSHTHRVGYTRVWHASGNFWQVVHERY